MSPLDYALDELHSSLIEFVRLLERESEALQTIQADDLAAIVEQKNRWSEAAGSAWNRLLIASGIDPRRGDSLEGTFSALPALRLKWLEVRKLAETADRLNQSNNILIEAQLRRTRAALDVLQSAANRGSLYGANGEMVDVFQSRHTLDKA